jgi:PAS domain S-box-containing protein
MRMSIIMRCVREPLRAGFRKERARMEGQQAERVRFQGAPLARALFHESGDALLLVDPLTERILDVNPTALRLSEFSRDELLRGSIRFLVRHDQEWLDWLVPIQQTSNFRDKSGFLLRTRRPETWVPVNLSVSRLFAESGEPVALFSLRDRREQVEAHRRLHQAEAEVRRVLVSVSECVWSCHIIQGKWVYRYLSPLVQRLTGRSAGFFLEEPETWQQIVDSEDRPRWLAFRQRLAAGASAELEYRIRLPDGARVQVLERVAVAPDDGALLLHGVVTDVGDRNLLAQVREARHQARMQRLESLSVLAGAVAHDFNNLITGILGHVSLARLPGPASNPDPGGLARIERITLRAADLCQQLRTLAGKGAAGSNPHDLNGLVRDIAEQVQRTLPERIRLQMSLSETLPGALGNDGELRRMIAHLLANAIEALGAEGEVAVRTLVIDPTEARVSEGEPSCFDYLPEKLASEPALACLEVHDNGTGLSPEAQEHLFDPFFSTRPGSRGLGLATVLGIVRAHHGGIRVLSAPHQGTTVRVYLPARPVAASLSVATPAPLTTRKTRQGTILLADDEDTVLEVASRLLSSIGYEVVQAKDGEDALNQFAEHHRDIRLALVDLTMPRLGGEETLRELRRRSPELPLVLMSGYPQADFLPHLANLNLAGYLQKPFRLPALVEILQKTLEA